MLLESKDPDRRNPGGVVSIESRHLLMRTAAVRHRAKPIGLIVGMQGYGSQVASGQQGYGSTGTGQQVTLFLEPSLVSPLIQGTALADVLRAVSQVQKPAVCC